MTEQTNAPLVEFDWSTIGKKQEQYSADDRKKFDDLYEKTLKTIEALQIIDGTVVGMNTREVIVNIGSKSDGVVPLSEFRYNPELKTAILLKYLLKIKKTQLAN